MLREESGAEVEERREENSKGSSEIESGYTNISPNIPRRGSGFCLILISRDRSG